MGGRRAGRALSLALAFLLRSNNPEVAIRFLFCCSILAGTLLRDLVPSTRLTVRRVVRAGTLGHDCVEKTFVCKLLEPNELIRKVARVDGARDAVYRFCDDLCVWRKVHKTGNEFVGCEMCQ